MRPEAVILCGTTLGDEHLRMCLWNWDQLKESLSTSPIELDPHPLLMTGITSAVIERNEDHQITLTTSAESSLDIPEPQRILGAPERSVERMPFSTPHGRGVLEGVRMRESHTSWGFKENRSLVTYDVSEVTFQASSDSKPAYTIDCLDNLPLDFNWPTGFDDNITAQGMRTFDHDKSFQFPISSGREISSYVSIKVSIGKHVCVLTVAWDDTNDKSRKPLGYLVYTNQPTAIVREKLRNSLSYALGLPLIYCGSSNYSTSGALCDFTAVTPETINGRAWSMTQMPPAPLTITMECGYELIDSEKVSKVASGIYNNMDSYGLESLPWRLWHADAAPYFMRPAYYGAIIEGLQKNYLKSNSKKIDGLLISKVEFNKRSAPLQKYIKKQEFDPLIENAFLNALRNSNSASQALKSKRFYESLGLKLSELEVAAWQRRNDAAHGNEIPAFKKEEFIRTTNILRTMLNRIVLSLTNASERYIDYYSYHYPNRALAEHITL